MATKQITTWDEFKTALTETITENTTYEIMNDIDVSDEILTNRIVMICNPDRSVTVKKTFNGNDKKINGITTYENINIFVTTTPFQNVHQIIFNNIHFTNFMIQNGSLFAPYNDTGYGAPLIFNSCFFNGLCNIFYSFTSGGSPYNYPHRNNFNKCSFNLKIKTTFINFDATLNNCYIIIDNSIAENGGAMFANGTRCVMSNCYLAGKWKSNTTNCYIDISYYYSGTSIYSTNNVFNIELSSMNTGSTLQITRNYNNDVPTLINADKIVKLETQTITHGSQQYLLTDSQLKSKTYIQQNTNFPLYG